MKKYTLNLKIILSLFFFFVFSLIAIYSAQSITSSLSGNIFLKQIIYYVIGFIILIIGYFYKDKIMKYAYLWYLGLCFLLLLLLFLGVSINGSRCWLMIGNISFQPSEFMKIALILVFVKVLDKYKRVKKMSKEFIMLLCILILFLIPSILTFLEPDTGVVIIYFIIMLGMLLYRGINKKWYSIIVIFLLIILGVICYLYFFQNNFLMNILGENLFYRMDRVVNWSKGNGYQLENSLIAIGSSGLTGFGINHIPIYFPEASTDFIFTTFSTNFGFLGNVLLISFFFLFDSSILYLCKKKTKKIDQYFLVGVFVMLVYQQIQNIAMTIGLLPITGITLPFISYGGSSLLSYMLICGMILRINRENHYIN